MEPPPEPPPEPQRERAGDADADAIPPEPEPEILEDAEPGDPSDLRPPDPAPSGASEDPRPGRAAGPEIRALTREDLDALARRLTPETLRMLKEDYRGEWLHVRILSGGEGEDDLTTGKGGGSVPSGNGSDDPD